MTGKSLIEEILPSLPRNEKGIENAYQYCSKQRRFVKTNSKEFSAHLEKAKSDLNAIKADYENRAWDWVIIKSYYAIHHAVNALLLRFSGFYSKDHICAILALKHFELLSDALYLKLRNINAKFSDFTALDITYSLRKISQYDVRKWKEISQKDADDIYSMSKELVKFAEEKCYE